MKRLFAVWRERRQHNREMKQFWKLLTEETIMLQEAMIGLAEVYADAGRMAEANLSRGESEDGV